jgi:hypothetical protein
MTKKTTTNEQETLFRKAVRVRSLTDPLGAMGFRTHSNRARRETRVRRFIFALTTLGFAGILGAVIATAPVQDPGVTAAEMAAAANRPGPTVRVTVGATTRDQQQPAHTRTRGS